MKARLIGGHPIHSKDPDVCCAWLCLSAGQRTRADNEALVEALEALPFRGKSLAPPPALPLNLIK